MFRFFKPSDKWMQGSELSLILLGTASGGPVWARPPGTIEGTTVTVSGTPLNGMCAVLYDAPGNNELIDLAPTGTDGIPGHYSSNTDFQQGVPVGAKVIFAPGGWGCGDSHGNFNARKWITRQKPVDISPGNTVTLNGILTEASP